MEHLGSAVRALHNSEYTLRNTVHDMHTCITSLTPSLVCGRYMCSHTCTSQVQYVDFGNADIVDKNDIVPVSNPDLFTIPQQVLCCQLHGVVSQGDEWLPGAARFFYGLVVDRIVTVEVKSVNITEIAPVSVKLSLVGFEQGPVQDIGMVLVANGYAVPSVFSLPLYEEASYMPHPPPDENPFRMMPICVQNDGVVVGQVDGIQEELEDLMDKVQNLCKRNTSHPRSCNELKKGQPCCAKFFEDNLWYRAVVDSTVDDKALVG